MKQSCKNISTASLMSGSTASRPRLGSTASLLGKTK
jgi:hypothetical protein